MQKFCSKCSKEFVCKNEDSGCWCEGIYLSAQILQLLNESYGNCLCADCLSSYQQKNTAEEPVSSQGPIAVLQHAFNRIFILVYRYCNIFSI